MEDYNVVTQLKGLSGFTWSDSEGVVVGEDWSAWNAYCQVSGIIFLMPSVC
jgi:hypothetical protein